MLTWGMDYASSHNPSPLNPLGLGEKMKVTRNCDFCSKEYQAEQRYLNRGQGRFCSKVCAGQSMWADKPSPVDNVFCSLCSVDFYLNESKKKSSKSGLFFCCRDHKDKAQRVGGIEAIMPPHYSRDGVKKDYRETAFENLSNECIVCGWNDYLEVLEVNHKDLDRSNNTLENLEILCPTHHQVFHFLDRSGRWARNDTGELV